MNGNYGTGQGPNVQVNFRNCMQCGRPTFAGRALCERHCLQGMSPQPLPQRERPVREESSHYTGSSDESDGEWKVTLFWTVGWFLFLGLPGCMAVWGFLGWWSLIPFLFIWMVPPFRMLLIFLVFGPMGPWEKAWVPEE